MPRAFKKEVFYFVLVIVLTALISNNSYAGIGKEIYSHVSPKVVYIFAKSGKERYSGTGAIIRSDGYVLTNSHVILDEKRGIPHKYIGISLKPKKNNITHRDLKYFYGQLVAYSRDYDLALLRMIDLKTRKPVINLPWLYVSPVKNVGVGTKVYALGHPGPGELWTQTPGEIGAFKSYKTRFGYNVYQHSAPTNSGNSGGPIVNLKGDLIGVHTFGKRLRFGGKAPGIGYAATSETVHRWIARGLGNTFLPRRNGRVVAAPKAPILKKKKVTKENIEGFNTFLKNLKKPSQQK